MSQETLAYNPEDWKDDSHLKSYGWGIVADDGRHINYATDADKAEFCKNMYDALSSEDSPHRVVQLFYKEEV
jgi:hypothetical protein